MRKPIRKVRRVRGGNISMKIDQIDKAQHDNQYKLSWKLINEISGRKASRKGQIEGDTKEERTAFPGSTWQPSQYRGSGRRNRPNNKRIKHQ